MGAGPLLLADAGTAPRPCSEVGLPNRISPQTGNDFIPQRRCHQDQWVSTPDPPHHPSHTNRDANPPAPLVLQLPLLGMPSPPPLGNTSHPSDLSDPLPLTTLTSCRLNYWNLLFHVLLTFVLPSRLARTPVSPEVRYCRIYQLPEGFYN